MEKNKWFTSTVQELFHETCETRQNKIAIVFEGTEISYAELQDYVYRCAQAMMCLGIGRGDHVAMLPSSRPEFVYVYFAALTIGAVVNPLNLLWGVIELKGVLRRNDPKMIVSVDKYMGRDYVKLILEAIPDLSLPNGRGRVSSDAIPTLHNLVCLNEERNDYEQFIDFEEFMEAGADYNKEEMIQLVKAAHCTDIQFICQTSGSTGLSKSALWNHRPPLANAHFCVRFMNFTEEDRFLNLGPLYHNSGINALNFVLAFSGAVLFMNEKFDPHRSLELIDKHNITSTFGFDPHWQGMRKAMDTGEYRFTITKAMTAASPQTFEMLHDEMCKTRNVNVIQLYAQTENGPVVSFVEPECIPWELRKGTHGRPLPGVEVVIKDIDTGEPVTPGQKGEICYRSPFMFQGYYKQEEETKKLFDKDGFFHSGDFGTFRNGYLVFMGRLGGVVKSGGENVSTTYVSTLLIRIFPDDFEDVQTFGVPDDYWGTKIVSWVRMKKGKELRNLKEISSICKGKMANYEIPKALFEWEGLWPMTSEGKIDMKTLQQEIEKILCVSRDDGGARDPFHVHSSSNPLERWVDRRAHQERNHVMTEGTVLTEKRDENVACVILDKPASMNAIDPSMMDRLTDCLLELEEDPEVNVIVLKGSGSHFSAGGDLSIANPDDPGELRNIMKRYGQTVLTIQQMEKPVIAMVKGYAVGGALSLVLACDMVIASEDAQFSSPFLRLGLTPDMGGLALLPMAIGLHRAKELWFTGRAITAQEGFMMGFISKVFSEEDVDKQTMLVAREISRCPQLTVRVTKGLTNSIVLSGLKSVMESEYLFSSFFLSTEQHKHLIEEFRRKKRKQPSQ